MGAFRVVDSCYIAFCSNRWLCSSFTLLVATFARNKLNDVYVLSTGSGSGNFDHTFHDVLRFYVPQHSQNIRTESRKDLISA